MTKLLPLALILLLAGMQTSCSIFQQQNNSDNSSDEKKLKTPPPLHLGAVHQVIPDRNFALLRIIGPMPKEGTVLISHPADGANDRVGNLVVAGGQHRRGNMIVADIRSGTVIKGDRVFLYRSISSASADSEEGESNNDTSEQTPADAATNNLPDFDSTPAVTNAGENPFSAATAPAATPQQEQPAEPNPEPPAPEPEAPSPPDRTDMPDRLQAIPTTLDGWN